MDKKSINILFIQSNPLILIGYLGQYILGVGIARYIGISINWLLFLYGIIWIAALHISTNYLKEYLTPVSNKKIEDRTIFSGSVGIFGKGGDQLSRNTYLIAIGAGLIIFSYTSLLLIRTGELNTGIYLLMGLIFLGSLIYSFPINKIAYTGYSELILTLIVCNLVPAFAYQLQTQMISRILIITNFPLTLFFIAMLIAFQLPNYATDIKYQRLNLLIRIGWENGILLHNAFIITAFILIGLTGMIEFPSVVTLPTLLLLPIGFLQIWHMRQIEAGSKPNWKSLTLNAVVLFGVTSYMMIFGFWMR